jgi:small subunit ribosomal protein S4
LIKVKGRPNSQQLVKLFLTETHKEPVPDFLEVIPGESPEGRMSRLPSRGDVDPRISDIREQLIIEIATR